MTGAGFPRTARLTRRAEFRGVFDHGRSRAGAHFIVYARRRDDDRPARLGVVISRKFGEAVLRNRLRRRLREVFRRHRAAFPAGFDLVVLPVGRGVVPADAEAARSLLETAQRAARAYDAKGPR